MLIKAPSTIMTQVVLMFAAIILSAQAVGEEADSPKEETSWEKVGAPPPVTLERRKPDVVIDYGTDNLGNPIRGEFYKDEFTGRLIRMNPESSGEWWPHP